LLEMETKRRELERARTARFKFAPGPSIGDLRDAMAAAHPNHGGSHAAFIAARKRWLEAGGIGRQPDDAP
jgi:hypothetical protein